MPQQNHAHSRIIALAAMMQTSKLVNDIARKGTYDSDDFHTLITSLFADNHSDASQLFGGREHLKSGFMLSQHLLSDGNIEQAKPIMAYTASMIAVEKKLSKQPETLEKIAVGMQRIQKQIEYFGSLTHESVIGGVADLYGDTISTLQPRIMIRGKPEILRQSANTHKVRALLFAGIRAAHLWRQHKGGHFRLLFGRKKLLREIAHELEIIQRAS